MQKFAKFGAVAATFATVLAFAVTASAAVVADFGTTTLKVGSKGTAVSAMQAQLNVCSGTTLATDGSFGPATKAAAVAFQLSNGLTGDGLVGNMTKAKLASCGSVAVTPTQGNCPAGYVAVTPVAPTFASCAVSSGTMTPSSTEGYLSDLNYDSTNQVSNVYESEQDKVLLGARATARLADQSIGRVTVTFRNTDTGSSANLGRYVSSVSLWNGSTKIGTMSVSEATRNNSDDTYTFQFTGLSSVIAKDQIGRLYVSVSANGTIDTGDLSATWTVSIPTGGIRATSPNGVYASYDNGGSAFSRTGISFGKFSANGVKAELNLSASNPAAGTVAVNQTSATNGVELLKFKIKARNSKLTLKRIPIQVISSAADVADVVNTLKLYNGSQLVDSVDGGSSYTLSGGAITTTADATTANAGFIFSNLSNIEILPEQTAEFTVVADIKSVTGGGYSEGNTLTTSFTNADALLTANFSVWDSNENQLTAGSSYRIGSAVGNVMTLRINGVQVSMGSATYVTTARGGDGTGGLTASDPVRVVYTIPLTVTSFGQTLYMGQIAAYDSAAAGTSTSAEAFSFGFNASTAPATLLSSGALATNLVVGDATISSSDALIEGDGFRLDSNTAKHFTLSVTIDGTASTAGATLSSYRVRVNDARFFTDSALTTGAANQSLLPAQSFQTGYQSAAHN